MEEIDWKKIAVLLFAEKEGWDIRLTDEEHRATEEAYFKEYGFTSEGGL